MVDAEVAPSAKGSGAAYVKNRFQLFVKKAKKKANQIGLGFIVMLDGDALGAVVQKIALEKLIDMDETLRSTFEKSVVVLIPTWSIDTWIQAICEIDVFETTKTTDQMKRTIDDEKVRHAALNFDSYRRRALPAHLPSIVDAQTELRKLDLA